MPTTPISDPQRKKIRMIEPCVSPIVRRMPMSRPLFFTSMTRPETMLSAAISTTRLRMMNITRRSTSSADRKAPEASRQVQITPRGPAAAVERPDASARPRRGSATMTSTSSAAPSRLK